MKNRILPDIMQPTVAGCATHPAGHARATPSLKLTFHLDHSAGADDPPATPSKESQFSDCEPHLRSGRRVFVFRLSSEAEEREQEGKPSKR